MRSARLIARWCELYTRGLEPAVALERRDELASDLFEQAAADPKAGVAMLSRAIRGVPADLVWRYEQRAAARGTVPLATRVLGGGVATVTAGAASALIVLGVFTLARRVSFGEQVWVGNGSWLLCLTLLAVIGALLLLRTKTRSLGALALAASSSLIHFVNLEFYTQSVTANELSQVAEWGLAVLCLVACLASVFLSAAILWLPRRTARS